MFRSGRRRSNKQRALRCPIPSCPLQQAGRRAAFPFGPIWRHAPRTPPPRKALVLCLYRVPPASRGGSWASERDKIENPLRSPGMLGRGRRRRNKTRQLCREDPLSWPCTCGCRGAAAVTYSHDRDRAPTES
jgi:hypothetical protein